MPFKDKTGKIWPDTMLDNGVQLILDPVASASSGRPKYRADPKQREKWAQQYGFAEKPAEQPGAMEGLALLGAGSAAMVGGQQLGSKLGGLLGSGSETGLSKVGETVLANQSGQAAGTGLANLSGSGVATPTGLSGKLIPVGSETAAEGALPATGITPYLGLAGAGLGAYGIKQAIDARDPKSGALSGAGMGLGLGAAAPLVGFGPLGWGALGLMALGGAGLGGGLTAALGHESTKEAQQRRWGGLSEAAQQLYSANHPENDDGIWDTGKYAGQEWTFEKAADLAKDDPTHFQGVYGNMAALGDRYFTLSDAQQKEFVRQNLASGNYASNKGDVIIKDKQKAEQIYQQIINPQPQQAQEGLAKAGTTQVKKAWMR